MSNLVLPWRGKQRRAHWDESSGRPKNVAGLEPMACEERPGELALSGLGDPHLRILIAPYICVMERPETDSCQRFTVKGQGAIGTSYSK